MKKILFISNISYRITAFASASIAAAHDIGLEFYHASNWETANACQIESDEVEFDIRINSIPFARNPFARTNIAAYRELVDLIRRENIDYIHCNTPVGGMLGRLAGKSCNVKKVIYQAHGFHFFKGAPWKNWLIYYPVERFLAHYTDCLITINLEDYTRAKRFRLKKGGCVEYVPGVGVATDKFAPDANMRMQIRKELGIQDNEIMLLSVGEINQNKNHKTVIEALSKLGRKDIRYVICGIGPLLDSHRQLIHELGLDDQVMLVGYRTDIEKFYQAADLFVIPSFREGLPVAPMEAMAAGLPCIASKIRGNVDLFWGSELLFDPHDINCLCEAIKKATDPEIASRETERNTQTLQRFSTEEVIKAMKGIYAEVVSK